MEIYIEKWLVDNPRGVIALVHGLGEHIGRYAHVAKFFNDAGFSVIGNDRYGHGKSPGNRGDAPSYAYFLDEIDYLIEVCEQVSEGTPVFLYGHSMGGQLVLWHGIEKPKSAVKGIVCSAPAVRLSHPPNLILIKILAFVEQYFPTVTQDNGLNLKFLSKDSEVITHYANDPLVHRRISLRVGKGMLDVARVLNEFKGDFPKPLFLMHGAEDGITDPSGTSDLNDRLTSDVEFHIWPGVYHEIHNEPEKQDYLKVILKWLESQLD